MKKNKIFIVLILMFLCIPIIVDAHPGRTDANGCHYCRTNCAKYGLNNGEYHCHNNSSSNVKTVVKQKSSDNTIRSIRIDSEKITVSENMIYHTTKDKLNIVVVPNNEYAEYKIDKTNLSVGENNITIKVTAEDGSIKNYNLLVIREGLSNNTDVSITVNNERINFNVEKPEITVSSEMKNLNYSYKLWDIKSTLKVTGDKNLKTGENIVTFTVVAEDNTQKDYILIVNKLRKNNSEYHTVVILSLILIVGCILEKKKRKKETTKSASN